MFDQGYIDLMSNYPRLRAFVREGVRAVVLGQSLPMTPSQLDGASRIVIGRGDMSLIGDEARRAYPTLVQMRTHAPGSTYPGTIAAKLARAMPMLTIARPTWKRDMAEQLEGVFRPSRPVVTSAVRRIQTAFRQARNNPYTPLGRRGVLRRAGFDPDNRRVMTTARRGAYAAPR